jgi:D-alanyl-D-alanine carboxypeptidase (penicillin-binding protein 5/6)
MARLARACLGHPRILEWAGMPAVEYREGSVKPNTNKLLGAYEGLDGLKTGYTNAAGWCFAGTALRDGVRLVAVVMGCDRNTRRFSATEELLEEGFAVVQRRRVLAAGQQMATAVPLNNAELDAIPLSAAGDVWVVTHDDDLDKLQFVLEHDPVIQAPVRPGDVLGSVEVRLDGQVVSRTDLTVDTPVPAGTWPWKLRQSVLRRGGGVAAGLS